jgi:hypothetical protein
MCFSRSVSLLAGPMPIGVTTPLKRVRDVDESVSIDASKKGRANGGSTILVNFSDL